MNYLLRQELNRIAHQRETGELTPVLAQERYLRALAAQPTAWESLPTGIRFAVWLWAIAVILGFIGGVILVLLTMAGIGYTFS